MAQTKEGLVVIIDIGQNTRQQVNNDESFYEKQKQCCTELIQKKIFADKRDEIAFIFMGTSETDNELNLTLDGYSNIVESIPMGIPTWNTLDKIIESINKENVCDDADWLDAVIVALDLLKRESLKKFKHLKIVLFHRFLTDVDESSVEMAIAGLKALNVEMVVINDDVQYADLSETNNFTTCVFNPDISIIKHKKSKNLITKVIIESNGILCNFDMAIERILYSIHNKSKPWFWYSNLEIGTKISIPITVTILIKEEKHFKWNTESTYSNTKCLKVTEYFKNDTKFDLDDINELINAYMIGSTPIPYDNTIGLNKIPTKKGMKCIAFTSKSYIPSEYLCGKGTYIVLPKSQSMVSKNMLNSLIYAMNKSNLVMIVRRVYNNNNQPKFIVLLPNIEKNYPCLTLFELFYSEQYINWDFPLLKNKKKFQPTDEQYSIIDNLIETMNLDKTTNNNDKQFRRNYNKHLISLEDLPNLTYEYNCHLATQRYLQKTKNLCSSLEGRDNAFKIPDEIIKLSKDSINQIKELFSLNNIRYKKHNKNEIIEQIGNVPSNNSDNNENLLLLLDNNALEYKVLGNIGTVTPSDDYIKLIERDIENENDDDIRKNNFDNLTKQICSIIYDLIFKSMTPQYPKIFKTIKAYREQALFYNPYDYNDWIKSIKNLLISRKMFDLWENVIVKNQLGLLWANECDFFDDMNDKEPEEFYKINKNNVNEQSESVVNEANTEDLLNDM